MEEEDKVERDEDISLDEVEEPEVNDFDEAEEADDDDVETSEAEADDEDEDVIVSINGEAPDLEEEEEARVLFRDDTLFIIIKSIILFGRSRRCQLRPSFAGVDFGQRDAHFVLLTPAGDSPRALVWTDFVV